MVHRMASDLFKSPVVHAILVTEKQNTANLYVFTTAFGSIADRSAPAPINLLNIPSLPESCVHAITEDPSESTVTDELDNVQINEDDVVNEEEAAELK